MLWKAASDRGARKKLTQKVNTVLTSVPRITLVSRTVVYHLAVDWASFQGLVRRAGLCPVAFFGDESSRPIASK